MEGTLACATFFSIHLCRKTHYEKVGKRLEGDGKINKLNFISVWIVSPNI